MLEEDAASAIDAGPASDAGPAIDGAVLASIPDVSGAFLLGLQADVGFLKPQFQFSDVNVLTKNTGGTATLNMEITPLTVKDRTPVGNKSTFSNVAVDKTGQFTTTEVQVDIPAEASKVGAKTGKFTLKGAILSADRLCGTFTGNYHGTWSAIRTTSGATGSALPNAEFACPKAAGSNPGESDLAP